LINNEKSGVVPTVSTPTELGRILVCIPALNEERSIAKVIAGALKLTPSVIVCDDGSSDATGEIARALNCKVVRHERSMGKGEALRTLFLAARNTDASVLVTIDGDGQHDPTEIPLLVRPILDGEADVVIGSRLMENGNRFPSRRAFGNRVLSGITNLDATDTQSGFRAYSRGAFEKLTPSERGMGVDSQLLMDASSLKMRIAEVPVTTTYDVPKPSKRNSAYHFLDVVASVVKISSIEHPLVFYGVPGLVLLLLGLVFLVKAVSYLASNGIVTNLVMTDGLVSMGLFIFGLLTIYTGIILFTLSTIVRKQQ
jgi:glycosyltransferase involved in cell wall biosynthesis